MLNDANISNEIPIFFFIQGGKKEACESSREFGQWWKYLAVDLNNKLDWADNANAIYKKGQSRSLRDSGILESHLWGPLFESHGGMNYLVSSLWGQQHLHPWQRFNRLVKEASSVLGCALDPVKVMGERRMMAKLSSLMESMSHPMLGSSDSTGQLCDRLLHPRSVKGRYSRSFLLSDSPLCSQ